MRHGRPSRDNVRRTEHGVHFREEDHPRSKHLINVFGRVATTTLIVNGAMIHLGPLGRVAEPLSSSDGLQLVEGNGSPDGRRTVGSIPVELDSKVSMPALSRLLSLSVRRAIFVGFCPGLAVLT